MYKLLIYLLLVYNGVYGYRVLDRENYNSMDLSSDSSGRTSLDNMLTDHKSFEDALEHWTGRWMPEHDPEPTAAPIFNAQYSSMHHGVPMGPSANCDDGRNSLEVDWDHSPVNYTCYGQKIIPDVSQDPTLYCEIIPEDYVAEHICMDKTIEYDDVIPIYGSHRPVWPVYGEYVFLPKQRWLHSLEHGGLVMLYHPCANPLEVERLKALVKNCLRRYVITPYSLMSEDRPLALVTWGCRLEMSYVNSRIVNHFIREKVLRGPEAISDDGDFSEGIINRSRVVTDQDDTTLCPQN